MKSELVDIEMIIKLYPKSGISVVVKLDEDAPDVVLPLSVVEIEEKGSGVAIVTLPRRFAEEKGLV